MANKINNQIEDHKRCSNDKLNGDLSRGAKFVMHFKYVILNQLLLTNSPRQRTKKTKRLYFIKKSDTSYITNDKIT